MDTKKIEIRKKIKSLGMTLKDFAEWVGLSYNTVKNWGSPDIGGDYSGRRRPIPKWVGMLIELEIENRKYRGISDSIRKS